MSGPLLPTPSPLAIREELETAVIRDLLGPAGGPEEEVDETAVRERYLVGILAPRRQMLEPETFDELAVGGEGTPEEGATDSSSLQTTAMFPSSFGMTFGVDGMATALRITARWGFYDRVPSEVQKSEGVGNPKESGAESPLRGRHHRCHSPRVPSGGR